MHGLPDHEVIGDVSRMHVEPTEGGSVVLTAFVDNANGISGYVRLNLNPEQTRALLATAVGEQRIPQGDAEDADAERAGADALPPEEARSALDAQLDRWVRQGKRYFAPKDLSPLYDRVALTDPRRWFNRERTWLLNAGVIRSDDDHFGQYEILRSPLAPE
ncbi:hypothetical protein [Streptomyces bottropensis]|uniref:hypothetical protein n=1 Tax=Streptomyces bottropensis TaxID=42235 RepID=UPI0036787221